MRLVQFIRANGLVDVEYTKIFVDYEKFRQLVWGERGQESSSYSMLIDWVVKNQINAGRYSRTDITNCYEKLLNDIYKEHIFPMCKKRK